MASTSTSTWRRAFNAWEKAVAPGLEDFTASREFRDTMAVVTKLNAAARRQAERNTRMWLHALNLPTATDVRKLRRQLSSLEKEVAGLRKAAEKASGQVPASRAAKLAEIDQAIAEAKAGAAKKGDPATKTGAGSKNRASSNGRLAKAAKDN